MEFEAEIHDFVHRYCTNYDCLKYKIPKLSHLPWPLICQLMNQIEFSFYVIMGIYRTLNRLLTKLVNDLTSCYYYVGKGTI